jgi:hypothetical protein
MRLSVILFAAVALGCSTDQPVLQTETPPVPLPPFAKEIEAFSAGPRHLERFFKLDGKHSFPDVVKFYDDFAARGGWTKVGPEEEHWSSGYWQEFRDERNRLVRQYTVHWAGPGRKWSLRLAMRILPEESASGAWVIVEEFALLGQPEWPAS